MIFLKALSNRDRNEMSNEDKHSPKRCPQCGRFAGCQTHEIDRIGQTMYDFYCKYCHLYFPVLAEIKASPLLGREHE